ncbi:MAG: hypothetical protein SVU32_08365, partial [Candidatus Nanohaloarchaea archaeon]|nr:hypothetical protein [Candidatus Nanohaloarchaea archaeon]
LGAPITAVIGSGQVTGSVTSIDTTTGSSLDSQSSEAVINSSESLFLGWQCRPGDHRFSRLLLRYESEQKTTDLQVQTWNGTEWQDIRHTLQATDTVQEQDLVVLRDQLQANGTQTCRARISNQGSQTAYIDYTTLTTYKRPDVVLTDIIPTYNNVEVQGIEPSESEFNVTIPVTNSENVSRTGSVSLWILDQTGSTIYSQTRAARTLDRNTTTLFNFSHIDTSTWSSGVKTLRTNATLADRHQFMNRSEQFVFESVDTAIEMPDYVRPAQNGTFTVEVVHPFPDNVTYNVTPFEPQGWTIEPGFKSVALEAIENGSVTFNYTAPPNTTTGNFSINVSTAYTFPGGLVKEFNTSAFVLSNDQPVVEVVREQPRFVGNDSLMKVRLVVHNFGTEVAKDVKVQEHIPSGWEAGNFQGGDSIQDNRLTTGNVIWTINSLGVRQYEILSYQIRAPPDAGDTGRWRWNSSWSNTSRWFNDTEDETTLTTTKFQEEHLEFDLEVLSGVQPRSQEPFTNQTSVLTVTNVGDEVIQAGGWNATVTIPSSCNVTDATTGTFSSGS